MSIAAPQAIERIHRVAIAQIDATRRLRQVDSGHVQVIADSIMAQRSKTESGLKQPITIRPAGENAYKLVMGAHRLAACTLLGDAEVDCVISFMDDFQARLAEIDENLCRAELTMFDRAAFLAERDHVWKCLNPEAGKGRAGAKARWHHATENFSFASGIADKVGLDERSIRNDVKMWRALSPDSRTRIPGTWLADHQGQLKALSKLGPDLQADVLAVLLRDDDPAASIAAALALVQGHPTPEIDPADKAFADLVARWGRAPAPVKARFRAFLAAEV